MIDDGGPGPPRPTPAAERRARRGASVGGSVGGWLFGQADRRMLVIVGAVAVFVISALAWSGRGAPVPVSNAARTGELAANPELLYTAAIREADSRLWAFGSPEQLAVATANANGTGGSVTVFDAAGEESWRTRFSAGFVPQWIDGDLLVTTPTQSGVYRLRSLEGDTGATRWDVTVPTPYVVVERSDLYVVDARRVSMLDPASGSVTKSVAVTDAGSIAEMLPRYGVFFDVGETAIQPLSSDLDPIGSPIPRSGSSVFGFADGETLVATGAELIRYDNEGNESGRTTNPFGEPDGLIGVGDSRWLATGRGRVALLRVEGSAAEVVWETPGAGADLGETDQFDYVAVSGDDADSRIYRVDSGELITSSKTGLQLWTNGYLARTGMSLRTYALPNREKLFDSGAKAGRSTFVIDNGYAVLDDSSAGVELSVFG